MCIGRGGLIFSILISWSLAFGLAWNICLINRFIMNERGSCNVSDSPSQSSLFWAWSLVYSRLQINMCWSSFAPIPSTQPVICFSAWGTWLPNGIFTPCCVPSGWEEGSAPRNKKNLQGGGDGGRVCLGRRMEGRQPNCSVWVARETRQDDYLSPCTPNYLHFPGKTPDFSKWKLHCPISLAVLGASLEFRKGHHAGSQSAVGLNPNSVTLKVSFTPEGSQFSLL